MKPEPAREEAAHARDRKTMMHPDTEIRFVSAEIGLGVFATKPIPKGTVAWVLDDLDIRLSERRVMSLDPLRQKVVFKYAYVGESGKYVLCWDHGRYMNHSANPNLVSTVYGFDLVARDILTGEELRCDYATLYGGLEDEPVLECAPEEDTSRTRVTPYDYYYLYKKWDSMAKEAFAHFGRVDQPLRYLIAKKSADIVAAIAAGEAEPESILTLYEERGAIPPKRANLGRALSSTPPRWGSSRQER